MLKFALPSPDVCGRSRVLTPGYVEPLSVGLQDDRLVVWALEHGDPPAGNVVERTFIVENTGRQVEIPDQARFLGTVSASTGIVWHVWAEAWDERSD